MSQEGSPASSPIALKSAIADYLQVAEAVNRRLGEQTWSELAAKVEEGSLPLDDAIELHSRFCRQADELLNALRASFSTTTVQTYAVFDAMLDADLAAARETPDHE